MLSLTGAAVKTTLLSTSPAMAPSTNALSTCLTTKT